MANWQEPRFGRLLLFCVLGVGLAWIGWSLHRDGWQPTWERWGMVSRSPFFADLRTATGAMDSIEQGHDPMISNPGSPFSQRFNYPRIWLFIFEIFDVRESDSAIIGGGFFVGLLVALWWLTAGISTAAAAYFALCFFSPATLLAIERGNLDLAIFFLVTLALMAARRHAVLGQIIVLFAYTLKLFPLAGLMLLLREPRSKALRIGVVCLVAGAGYFAATFSDMLLIWSATEKGADVAYGYNVLWHYLRLHSSPWTETVRYSAFVAVGLSLLGAGWRAACAPPKTGSAGLHHHEMDGYRIGASIYSGTFLLGNSWDYRLIFFFFAVPQLFVWLRSGATSDRFLAGVQLGCFAVAVWAMWLTFRFARSAESFALVRGLEEIAKWGLFATSLWLLAATLPNWIRPILRGRFHDPDAKPLP